MVAPSAVAQAYADALVAAGVRAFVDPGRFAPPCVLFLPPGDVSMDVFCGSGTARMRAVVAAGGGPANGDAWRLNDAFLAQVLATDVLRPETVEHGYYTVDGTPGPPMYELSWTEEVSWI